MLETDSSPLAAPEPGVRPDAPTSVAASESASLTEETPGSLEASNVHKAAVATQDKATDAREAPAVEAAEKALDPAAAESIETQAEVGAAKSGQTAPTSTREAPRIEPPRATLIPFVAPQPQPQSSGSRLGAFGRFATDRRFQTGAAAACLAFVAVVAGGATLKEAADAQGESQRLAQAVSAINARIEALEAAKPRDEAAEFRKAVNEARGGLATSRDLSANIAQMNARLDRMEHEQQARLDKLGEHLEHDAAGRSAEAQARGADVAARLDQLEKSDVTARLDRLEKADFASRIDKLEKADVAARIDKMEKKIATQSAAAQPAAAPLPPQKETSVAQGVSNEVTGSIEKPRPTDPIHGWYLVEIRNGSAIVENRQGLRQIAPGDSLAGAGKVERFERRGREWVVVTDQGVIVQAPAGSYASRVVLRPPMYGPYGGFGPGYGGYED
jgi:hypothetical protein